MNKNSVAIAEHKQKRPHLAIEPDVAAAEPIPALDGRRLQKCGGTRSGWPTKAVLAAADALAIALAVSGSRIAINLASGTDWQAFGQLELKIAFMFALGLMVLAHLQGLYSTLPQPPALELRNFAAATALTVTSICLGVQMFIGIDVRIAFWVIVAGMTVLGAIPVFRASCRLAFCNRRWWGTRVIVVGSGGLAWKAYDRLANKPQLGLRPVGFVEDVESLSSSADPSKYVGPLSAIAEIARASRTDRAVVAVYGFDAHEIASLVTCPAVGIRHWIMLPPLERFPSLWVTPCEAGGMPALQVSNRLVSRSAIIWKRAFDIALTLLVAVVTLPLFALIILLIRTTSPGPALYGQVRIGLHGRRFTAWKFRTMLRDADRVLEQCLAEDPALRAEWQATHKLRRDPRVTWIGRILRVTSLDELPQMWNVLRGDMSLVGPRPIVEAEIDKYAEQYQHYVQVQPGVTGLWQISGRNNTTYSERVDYDAYYVKNWSPWLDVYILACTAKVVLLGEGAY